MTALTTKYIDLLTDYGFKRVFGNKELLIPFLNALFEEEGKVIKSVTYINKEMTPANRDDRTIFYDVLCKVDGQEDIIIEMQHKPQDTFRERSLYYMSRAIDEQGAGKRKWKYKLHPVYGIFITNFHLKDVQLPEEPVSQYVIKNAKTNEVFTDKFKMFFIDLLTFKKTDEDDLNSDLEKWIYSIKNMGNMTTTPRMASTGVFHRLYSEAELAALSKRERNIYERSLRNYRDMLADKETTKNMLAREKKAAREEGLAEGRAEGRAEAVMNVARNLKSAGMDMQFISQATGLTIEEIEAL